MLSARRDARVEHRPAGRAPEDRARSDPDRLRLAGNRALATFLPPRPVVQRAMYLDNQDDLIYKDSNNAVAEYAFVHKAANRTAFYVDYPNVAAVQAAVNARLHLWPNPRATQLWFDNLVPAAAAGNADAVAILGALGTIYADSGAGLQANPGINSLVIGHIALKAVGGPGYNHVGGGSRLPRAEGYLYLNKDSRLDLLGWLGVDQADLANVQVARFSGGLIQTLPAQLAGMGFTNLKTLSVDPASGVIDVVYQSTVVARRSANARVRCNGLSVLDDLSNLPAMHLGTVTASFNGLAPPTPSTGWIPGTQIAPMDRGAGQLAAMDNWNALGAAAWENSPTTRNAGHDLNQNWEWLHVRGAKLGGATAGGNLVAGLFVTNSEMIPFEDMVYRWAEADPTKFWAKFRAVGGRPGFATRIEIGIKAVGHRLLGNLHFSRFVSFDPLRGKVVDKVGGEVIKRHLDRARAVS